MWKVCKILYIKEINETKNKWLSGTLINTNSSKIGKEGNIRTAGSKPSI